MMNPDPPWREVLAPGGADGTILLAMELVFLEPDEQLVRVHRFRYRAAVGCALGSMDIVVEEALGPHAPAARCVARPDHPRFVPRPEYAMRAGTVEAALQLLIERIRGRPLSDAFLPAG